MIPAEGERTILATTDRSPLRFFFFSKLFNSLHMPIFIVNQLAKDHIPHIYASGYRGQIQVTMSPLSISYEYYSDSPIRVPNSNK